MVPRSQRSIFHLGEEGGTGDDHHRGADHVKSIDSACHHLVGRRNHGRQQRRERDAAADAVVGLQILVQHRYHHHARATSHSHIVLKQMVLLRPTPAARHRRAACGGLLRACSLCRRELSPDKDVYMYRGDQGFCSEESRWQQILVDDAREREAMIKKERRGQHLHHHHGPQSAAASAVRGAPRRLLVVA